MNNPGVLPVMFDDTASGWERALHAVLAEKEVRLNSR